MTLPSITAFLPLCNVQASAVIEAISANPTTGVLCAAIDTATGNVYIGGNFQKVNGVTRQGLACINRSGVLQSWNPGVGTGTQVNDMRWVAGTGLYVIGNFTAIGGGSGTSTRYGQALINSSGVVQTWDPNPTGISSKPLGGTCMAVDGSGYVYLANGNALFQVSSSAVITTWNTGLVPLVSSGINSMVIIGTKLYLAGGLAQVNTSASTTQTLTGLCRINLGTGYGDAWAPSIAYSVSPGNETLFSITADSGGSIYIAGNFTSVLGTTQRGYASIAPAGPTLNSWLPSPTHTGNGWKVAANGTDIYWCSQYAVATGGSIKEAGCMSAAGTDLAWDPWAAGPQGGSSVSKPPINGFIFDLTNPVVNAVYIYGYFGNVLYGGSMGPITRYQYAKFADRSVSPAHLAY